MRALVTGGHGFLGRPLVAQLRAELGEAAVWAPTRSEMGAGFDARVAEVRPDVVWHLAGRLNGTDEDLRRDNEHSAARLFEALRTGRVHARVVLASSAAVYGRGGQVVIARISNPVGAGMGDHLLCGTVASQVVAIERGAVEPALHLRDLTPLRDFVHVADVADALRHLADYGVAGEVYHVAAGRSLSARAIVDLFLAEARTRPIDVRSTIQEASRSPMQEQWLSIARIEATGWKPARGLREAAAELLDSRRAAPAERSR